MRVQIEHPSDDLSPDRSTCEHCKQPISWDEVCYTHDSTGFADCYLTVSGGVEFGLGLIANPELKIEPPSGKEMTKAEPITWFRDE